MIEDDRRYTIQRHLKSVPERYTDLIRQAAEQTGFDVYVSESFWVHISEPDGSIHNMNVELIDVYTREPQRDHGPFWAEYHRLKLEMEHTDE